MKAFEVETLLNVAAQGLQLAFPLLLIFIGSVYLDNAAFLNMAAVTYWLAVQITIIGFGFDTVVTKEIAEANIGDRPNIFSFVVYSQLLIWMILSCVFAGYASLVDSFPWPVAVAGFAAVGYAVGPPWLAMALGLNSRVLGFGLLVRLIGITVIIVFPENIVIYYLVFAIVTIATSAKIFIVAVQDELLRRPKIFLPHMKSMFTSRFRLLLYSGFAKLSVAAYTTAIPLTVSQYGDVNSAKAFVIAERIKNIINYGIGATLPVFNRFYFDPVIRPDKLMRYYIFGLFMLIGLVFFVWFFGPVILSTLRVEDEIAPKVLLIMCLSVIPIYLTNYFGVLRIFLQGHMKSYLLPLLFFGIFALFNLDYVLTNSGILGVALMSFSIEVGLLCTFMGLHFYHRSNVNRD